MLYARHQVGLCGTVGTQLVGDNDPWGGTLTLEQLAHEPQGCPLVPPALQERIEDVTVCIDGAPQPVPLSLDSHHQASGAGEFHPHALSEPDVILSHHPAPIVRPYP